MEHIKGAENVRTMNILRFWLYDDTYSKRIWLNRLL
jgi:hypothetical protein